MLSCDTCGHFAPGLILPRCDATVVALHCQIREIGVSNETPYGITKMAQLGERLGYPRVASVQVTTLSVL